MLLKSTSKSIAGTALFQKEVENNNKISMQLVFLPLSQAMPQIFFFISSVVSSSFFLKAVINHNIY